MSSVAEILLVLVSPALLGILAFFVLGWRKMTGKDKDVNRLRQELSDVQRQLAALRADYGELKTDHTDALLGLEADQRRLEARLDRYAGIDAAPPAPEQRVPHQRQL